MKLDLGSLMINYQQMMIQKIHKDNSKIIKITKMIGIREQTQIDYN